MKFAYLLFPLALAGCGKPEQVLRDPVRTVTADDVLSAFLSNEIAARRDFQDVPVTITGEIVMVDDGLVMLNTAAGPRVGLNMLPEHSAGLVNLKAGESYKADCEGAFEVQGVIGMQDCRPRQ